MVIKYCDGKTPAITPAQRDSVLQAAALKTIDEVEACFGDLSLHKALIAIWEFINTANKYIVENEPWNLAKDPVSKEKLLAIMYNLLVALRAIAILITPFMPQTAEKILRQIGITESAKLNFSIIRKDVALTAGSPLIRGDSLFPRIEVEKEVSPAKVKADTLDLKPVIDYEDFAKIDLRVAKILEAEAVPKSNKLLKLKIDIGEERTIVAGIGKDYNPADLVGKKVVIVANLKPAKLMGVESRGMILATDTDQGLTILSFDKDAKTGAKIR
jgi:methionyl-tRNA synthetase